MPDASCGQPSRHESFKVEMGLSRGPFDEEALIIRVLANQSIMEAMIHLV